MQQKKKTTITLDSIVDGKIAHLEQKIGKKIQAENKKQTKLFDTIFRNLLKFEIGRTNGRIDTLDRKVDTLDTKLDLVIKLIKNTPTREEFKELQDKVEIIDKRTQPSVN
ncbi:hypothetical protein HY468_00715 [Candidatus Roizmanbacteria bacterium]|nr:hypothetical protein [Candidatus Roizmanbacteria bacterium]